CARYQSGYDYW
nr:immunoglobulin heavy chain junction region [Macaca mulatta]MOW75301.1 immunoglobulin heavy chain junction region [Macaca mulatta]MOW75826.1 immunoglobulin heavy chain junction region [Macaca mulatta]MOW75939.1 immunoglobulin heavy chain junction region [Macaca mulatta]MOW76385.1 immunoglobulin heavy chain junction region [Macaca mulatta]